MSAHVLFNILNKLGKRDKIRSENDLTMSDLHFYKMHFTRDCSKIKSILLNVTISNKTNKIENKDLFSGIFRQFKVAYLFENVKMYLQFEKYQKKGYFTYCYGRKHVVVGHQKSGI